MAVTNLSKVRALGSLRDWGSSLLEEAGAAIVVMGQKHIGSNATGRNGAYGISDIINNALSQFSGRNIVHLQVGCGIDEGLINGVSVDILRSKMFEENTVDLCSAINIELHPGWGNDIFDIAGYIPDPATVLDA